MAKTIEMTLFHNDEVLVCVCCSKRIRCNEKAFRILIKNEKEVDGVVCKECYEVYKKEKWAGIWRGILRCKWSVWQKMLR